MPVAAVCPVHGPFASRGLGFENSSGNLERVGARCPECGRVVRVMEGKFSFDGERRATVISAPAWSIEALRSVQGELESLREKVEDTTLPDFTLDQIVEETAQRILDQREDPLTRKILQGVEELLAADRADRHRRKKRLRPATIWFLNLIIGALAQIGAEYGLQYAAEHIDFDQVWTAVHQAVAQGPEGGGTSGW